MLPPILRGLLYLLVDQDKSLLSHVRKHYDPAGKPLFEPVNAWVAVSEIFMNVVKDVSLLRTYLIIDALDECINDVSQLLDFIVKMSSLYPRVKWIVSSRNWPSIEERLNTATHKLCLCLENEESVSTAVSLYIKHKVDQLAQEKNYER